MSAASGTPSPFRRVMQMARGGTASVAAAVIATNLLRIVSSTTLTRLLDAESYGIVGLLAAVSTTIVMLSDIGTYPFIVRHKDGDEPRFLNAVWTMRLVRSVGLMLLLVAASGPIARFMGKPELGPVLAVWSFSFVIAGFSSLAFATAVRQRKLWRLSALDLLAMVAQIFVSIIFALILRNYWSMVIGLLAGGVAKAVLSYALFPGQRRRWAVHAGYMKEMWSFSRYIAPSSLLTLLILQADKLVLGRMMTLQEFGFYAVATTLAGGAAAIAGPYAKRVLFSSYSAAVRTAPERLGAVFYTSRRKVALLYMFAIGGLIGGAPLLVEILYDPRYRAVGPVLQILAVSVMLRLNNMSAEQALIALGDTRAPLMANLARVAWLAVGGAAAILAHDVRMLVVVIGTVEIAAMLRYWWTLRATGLLDLREELLGFAGGATGVGVGTLVMLGSVALLGHL